MDDKTSRNNNNRAVLTSGTAAVTSHPSNYAHVHAFNKSTNSISTVSSIFPFAI